jgi:hypothetical protein
MHYAAIVSAERMPQRRFERRDPACSAVCILLRELDMPTSEHLVVRQLTNGAPVPHWSAREINGNPPP